MTEENKSFGKLIIELIPKELSAADSLDILIEIETVTLSLMLAAKEEIYKKIKERK